MFINTVEKKPNLILKNITYYQCLTLITPKSFQTFSIYRNLNSLQNGTAMVSLDYTIMPLE